MASKAMISAWKTERTAVNQQIATKKKEIKDLGGKASPEKVQKASKELQELVKQKDALDRKIDGAED